MDLKKSLEAVVAERDELKEHCSRLQALVSSVGYPPGHFYSPIVDIANPHATQAVRGRIAAAAPMGIDLDATRIASVMKRLAVHYPDFPFPRQKTAGFRFYYDNPFFGCHDGFVLFAMLRKFRPKRVIEVGCGFSSCVLLDTNDRFPAGTEFTFIDPALTVKKTQLGALPESGTRFIEDVLQNVSLGLFQSLQANDILFIDSSHVSKTGSDVNHYVFHILPLLKPGVLVHIHDILYPFEYPENWVLEEKRSWNEAYVIRAFLQYNSAFEVFYWNNFAWHKLRDSLRALMPLCLENEGGSLWLRVTG